MTDCICCTEGGEAQPSAATQTCHTCGKGFCEQCYFSPDCHTCLVEEWWQVLMQESEAGWW